VRRNLVPSDLLVNNNNNSGDYRDGPDIKSSKSDSKYARISGWPNIFLSRDPTYDIKNVN